MPPQLCSTGVWGMAMQGWQDEMRSVFRCRAWQTAGALLLALMSGALGCQGAGDHLRNHVSNDVPAAFPPQGQPPQMISPAKQPEGTTTEVGVAAVVYVEPAESDNGILQVGATQIVPPTEKGEAPSSI